MIDFEYYVNNVKIMQKERDANRKYDDVLRSLETNIFYKNGKREDCANERNLALAYCKRFCNYVEKDAIQGCLIGGAIGDAFGFPVEFYEDCDIFRKYGENGITQLQLYGGIAHVSDDTQMTLFTADGLLSASKRFEKPTVDGFVRCIYESYMNWLYTQDHTVILDEQIARSDLLKIQQLHYQRAPGGTCLQSLRSGKCGTFTCKLNDSKGCGGIMRVAPIALYLAQMKEFDIRDVALLAAKSAAITHSHPLGYIPTAFLAVFIWCIVKGECLQAAYQVAFHAMRAIFSHIPETRVCLELVEKARRLADPKNAEEGLDDLEAIRMLGAGWVAEETLAIAVYCALKYSDNFEQAMIAASNHSGDSDSTAAVTGNVLGAYLGLKGIPRKMTEHLELKDVTLDLAEKMHLHKLSTEVK